MKNFTAQKKQTRPQLRGKTSQQNGILLHLFDLCRGGGLLILLLLISIELMGQNCSTLATCNFENGSMPSSVGIMTSSTGVSNSNQNAQPYSGSNFGICDFTFCNGMFGMSSCVMPGTTVTISGMTRSINVPSTAFNQLVDADFEVYAAFLDYNGATLLITGPTTIFNQAGQNWHSFTKSYSVPANAYEVFIGFDAPHNPSDYDFLFTDFECADNPAGGDIGFDELVISSSPFTPIFTATPTIQNICEGSTANLSATSNIGGIASWDVYKNGVFYSQFTGNNIQTVLSTPGTYIFTTSYSCTLPCYVMAPPCTVIVHPHPQPPQISLQAGSSSPYCVNGVPPTLVINTQNNNNFELTYNGMSNPVTSSPFTVPPALGATVYTATSNLSPLVSNCNSTPVSISLTGIPAPTLSASNILVCNGSTTPVTLYASPSNYSNYNWVSNSGIQFNINGNGSSITVNGPFNSNEVFTVSTVGSNGCSATAVASISIAHDPLLSISGISNTCSNQILNYSLVGFSNSYQAFWSIDPANAGTFVGGISSGGNVSIDWDNMAGANATINVTYYYGPGCSSDISFEVEPCCAKVLSSMLVIDGNTDADLSSAEVNISQILGGLLTVAPPFTISTGTYQSLLFGGTINIDMDLVLSDNLFVDMLPGTKINILPGYTLTIRNEAVLKAACDEMWDGIYLDGSSNLSATNIPRLKVFNGVTIRDMENGIVVNNNAIYEIGNNQASVKLNKNYKNITVTGYSNNTYTANHPSFVKNCRFTCEASTYTEPDDYLIAPHANQVTFYGINILKVDNITIGEATPMQFNLFENMNFGIISKNSSINVYNNHFNHITPVGASESCDCKCREGAAICAAGRVWAFGWPNPVPPVPANNAQIGGFSNYQKNSFNDCLVGVQLTAYMNSNIIDNSFDNIKVYGISAANHIPLFSNTCQLNIIQNEFYNVHHVHCQVTNYTSVTKLIETNKFNLNPVNLNSLQTTAISVKDPANAMGTNLRIDDNIIKMVQIGIDCTNQNRAEIDNNNIALATLNYVTDANRSHGIRIDHCNRTSVNDNLISADNRDNWWTHGITADYSDGSYIFCNHTYKTGHGIVWSGSYSTPKIYNNNMHRNAAGLTINWASIGHQLQYSSANGPEPMYADNIWVGPYANYYHTKVYTCPTCPPIGIMYARAQQGTAYLPNPFYAFSDPIGLELKPEFNPNQGTLQWINAEENNHYCNLQSAQETNDIIPVSNANLLATENPNSANAETADGYWWEVYQKYMQLSTDTLLDSIATNWLDSMSNTAIGQLYAIGTNINPKTSDPATIYNLQIQNNLVIPQTQQEVVFKNANALWLQALQFINDSNYVGDPDTSFDFNSVKDIAWECPKSHGPGVYSMRVLANLLDNVWVNYNNNCENPRNENEERRSIYYAQAADHEDESHDYDFLNNKENEELLNTFEVYPNPNAGSFFVNVENMNPSQVLVNVYNAIGQNIEVYVQHFNGNIISVDMNKQPKGIYLIEILSNQKIIGRTKISIAE